jgi:hypothetical protein
MLEQVEEPLALEYAAHQHLELRHRLWRVAVAIDGAPHLEPFLIRGDGPDASLGAVAHDQRGVVLQKRADFRLVRLELCVRAPDRRVLVRRVLELDEAERQAVYEDDDVGATVVLILDDGELIYGEPVVRVD